MGLAPGCKHGDPFRAARGLRRAVGRSLPCRRIYLTGDRAPLHVFSASSLSVFSSATGTFDSSVPIPQVLDIFRLARLRARRASSTRTAMDWQAHAQHAQKEIVGLMHRAPEVEGEPRLPYRRSAKESVL